MFQFILAFLDQQREFYTLGRKSRFSVILGDNSFTIVNSQGKSYLINENLFLIVWNRYNLLSEEDRNETKHYTLGYWPASPAKISAPYIASIIKLYIETQNRN
ncbi:MAG: hypothetical protein RIR48_2813 [Bacteroidota bacterium]|jgi:hypothetical protein